MAYEAPSASTEKAVLAIEPMQKGELQMDFVSLFPQDTYKGRKNGMRRDLAEALEALHPQFIRFPGGCASHGNGIDNIGRSRSPKHLRCYDTYRSCGVLQLGVTRHARYHDFVQVQMAEKHVGRVLRMVMFYFLCCHSRANTQQWQDI